jgi:hypothetical protein
MAIGILATLGHHFLFGRVRALVHDFEWAGHTLYELLTVGDMKADVSHEDESE